MSKLPNICYFLNVNLGLDYVRALANTGYVPGKLRVVVAEGRLDYYAHKEGDWLAPYTRLPGKDPYSELVEQCRIVQLGSRSPDFIPPPNSGIYSIGIIEFFDANKLPRSELRRWEDFDEVWVYDPVLLDLLAEVISREKLEYVCPENLSVAFDPYSLV